MASGSTKRMRTAIHKFMADRISDLREKMFELFTEHDYNVNQQDYEGNTYLHHVLKMEAAVHDDRMTVPLVYLLGRFDIDPTLANDAGETPLHLAVVLRCSAMMISALLKIGADPLQPNRRDLTPLRMAMKSDDWTYLTLFTNRPTLTQAAKQRDFRKIEYYVKCCYKTDPISFGTRLSVTTYEDPDVQFAISNEETKINMFHACLAGDLTAARENYYLLPKEFKVDEIVDPMFTDNSGRLGMTLMGYALLLNLSDVAMFLLEIGADVNFKLNIDNETKIPLFWYVLSNLKDIDYASACSAIIHKADIASLRRDAAQVLYLAWLRKWPLDIVQPIVKTKAFLSRRNIYGHTARDLILIKAISDRMPTWREELYFIDRHVRDMLDDYDYGRIEELVLSGYEQVPKINVVLPEELGPKPSLGERQRMENAKKMKELFDNYNDLKKAARQMFASIETGNMPDFREAVVNNKTAVQMTDKCGRSMLSLAIIFERRVLAKYLLDNFPDLVYKKDAYMRTAMHYAVALEDTSELEHWIKEAGCGYEDLDIYGKKPMDYDNEDGLAMCELERGRLYGADAYCLEMYVRFEDAIKKGNFDMVQKLHAELNEIPIEVITRDMYCPSQYRPPREIIFIAVDEDKEAAATWLIKKGAAWDVTSFLVSKNVPHPINLYTAASLKGMTHLRRLIKEKEEEFREKKEREFQESEKERLKDVERQMKYEEKMIREGNLDDEILEDDGDDVPDGWDDDGKNEPAVDDPSALENGMMQQQQQWQQQQQQFQQQQQQQQQYPHQQQGNKGCSLM